MSKATATLGLAPEATAREIKTAFRELSLLHHPDVGGDKERFELLHAAYETALAEASERPCSNCKGRGRVTTQRGWVATEVPCPDCGGTGYQD